MAATGEKIDVFVGNLAYGTTEEQLRELFEEVGFVLSVRIVADKDTGKPRGFAFVEYADVATALSAIRNLDGRELNSRKLRVSYSNNSTLKEQAQAMGQAITDSYQSGGKTIEGVVGTMALHEAYDVLAAMKDMAERDMDRARQLLRSNPQLYFALLEIQKRLGMRGVSQSDGPSPAPHYSQSEPDGVAPPGPKRSRFEPV